MGLPNLIFADSVLYILLINIYIKGVKRYIKVNIYIKGVAKNGFA